MTDQELIQYYCDSAKYLVINGLLKYCSDDNPDYISNESSIITNIIIDKTSVILSILNDIADKKIKVKSFINIVKKDPRDSDKPIEDQDDMNFIELDIIDNLDNRIELLFNSDGSYKYVSKLDIIKLYVNWDDLVTLDLNDNSNYIIDNVCIK